MFEIFRKLIQLLSKKERMGIFFLTLLFFLTAVLDVVGLAFIVPFVNIIKDPSLINEYFYTRYFNEKFQFENDRQFILYFGACLLLYITASQAFRMLCVYLQLKFTYGLQYRLTQSTTAEYLSKDYSFFVENHSADLSKDILSEISVIIIGLAIPALQLVSSIFLVLLIASFLLYIDPFAMCLIITLFGGTYGGLILVTKTYQTKIGIKRFNANAQRFKILNNIFSSVKEIKFYSRENLEVKNLNKATFEFATAQSHSQGLSHLPKYFIETIILSVIIILSIYLSGVDGDSEVYFSIIITFAFGIYKLMPALQQIFFSYSQVRFNAPSLLNISEVKPTQNIPNVTSLNVTALPFDDYIALENVSYRHPQSDQPCFQHLDLKVRKNSIIGITGPSGGGKSTLVNLLLGVLKPDSGGLCIDGQHLTTSETFKLHTIMSYVPQDIFIIDDTIAKNIALYGSDAEIDYKLLEKVIKITELESLIKHEMPKGFETVVGERGNRISGGQKQRIGLARALYRQPKILILDEATSALDTETEKRVMSHISKLRNEMTIIMIAHRLNTLDICNEVYNIEQLNSH